MHSSATEGAERGGEGELKGENARGEEEGTTIWKQLVESMLHGITSATDAGELFQKVQQVLQQTGEERELLHQELAAFESGELPGLEAEGDDGSAQEEIEAQEDASSSSSTSSSSGESNVLSRAHLS